MTNMSLYHRLGGPQAVGAAVAIFYGKVSEDPLLAPMFKGVDLQALAQHQFDFMRYAFGGTEAYDGRDLYTAHIHLVREKGLSDVHFDAVARHLRSTLMGLSIASPLIQEVMTIIESVRDDVLGRRETPLGS